MFIDDIKYPSTVQTEQQLKIFFDYAVHGVIDEICYSRV